MTPQHETLRRYLNQAARLTNDFGRTMLEQDILECALRYVPPEEMERLCRRLFDERFPVNED